MQKHLYTKCNLFVHEMQFTVNYQNDGSPNLSITTIHRKIKKLREATYLLWYLDPAESLYVGAMITEK